MRRSIMFLLLFATTASSLLADEAAPSQSASGAGADCPGVEGIFFDLGDTLVENDGTGTFVLRSGAAETVAALQDLGKRLGIITNVPADWTLADLQAILAEPEFLNEFEVVVLSSEAPAPKPDPAIFTFAHGLLTDPPLIDRIAFVTESLSDIANTETNPTLGARAVGMTGIHLSNAAPSPLTDYTIATNDLPEIVNIVGPVVFCDGFESGNTDAW